LIEENRWKKKKPLSEVRKRGKKEGDIYSEPQHLFSKRGRGGRKKSFAYSGHWEIGSIHLLISNPEKKKREKSFHVEIAKKRKETKLLPTFRKRKRES